MDVPLYKPRQQHLSGKIHDTGSRPDERPHAGIVAHVDDLLVPNGYGARPFSAAIHGVDGAVAENDFGPSAARQGGCRRRRNADRCKRRACLQ